MPNLNHSQKDAIGLNFVLNRLAPRSPYGTQAARQAAAHGPGSAKDLNHCFDNMENVQKLAQNNSIPLEKITNLLAHFKNIRTTIEKCVNTPLGEVELFELKDFLLHSERLIPLFDNIKRNFIGISFIPTTLALNILDPHNKRIAPFAIEDDASPDLSAIRAKKAQIEAAIQKEPDSQSKNDLLHARTGIVAQEDAQEMLVMADMTRRLRQHLPAIRANMDALGLLDLTIAKAMLAQKMGAVRPKISTAHIMLKNMHNPMVAQALAPKAFTKVSLHLGPGTTIITGANMGGKSVAIKTAVLNIALCRLGFFVFAEYAEIPLLDGLCLLSDDLQDALKGLSSFGAEITWLNKTIALSKQQFLFIALDELARATNPAEGAAIVRATAAYLAQTGCICLMSTHYDRAAGPGMRHYQVAGLAPNADNPANIGDYMDYNLIEVAAATAAPKDALRICKLLGLAPDLLAKIEAELE